MMTQNIDNETLVADTSEPVVTSNVSNTTCSIKANSDFTDGTDDVTEQTATEEPSNFVVKGIVKDDDSYLEIGKEKNSGDYMSTEQLLSLCKAVNREDGNSQTSRLTLTKNYSKVNVYFTSIPLSWNTAQLKHLCKRFGPIVSATVAHHPHYNTSLGYGFVLFVEPASAARCVEELTGPNASMYGGIRCRYAQDKATPYIVQLKQLKQKRMEAQAISSGADNSQAYDGNSNEINNVLNRELTDEEVKLLMKEVNKEAAASSSSSSATATKPVANQLHMDQADQEQLQYCKNDNKNNSDKTCKGSNNELRGVMNDELLFYHPAHSLLANNQRNTYSTSNRQEINYQQANMEINTSLFRLPPPPPPPPYETIDVYPQEYMPMQHSLPPSPPCEINGFDASLFYSCPVASYEEPFHYAHSAPNNLSHIHASYDEAVELQRLQHQQQQQQQQQQHEQQQQILPSTMISAPAPREAMTTSVHNPKFEKNENVKVSTGPYVTNDNTSFNNSFNKHISHTLPVSLQSQKDEEPLPMPTAIPTAIIEASALGKSVEELHRARTYNLASLTSASNTNIHPNFNNSNKPSLNVQPVISSSAPAVMSAAPLLMNLYGSSSSMAINGMNNNNIITGNSCNANIINKSNNSNTTSSAFSLQTMGVGETNMLLHPLETSFATNAPSNPRNNAAQVNNNINCSWSFITTNVTNATDIRNASSSNLDSNYTLNNVNDSFSNNNLSGANSFITHAINNSDIAKATNTHGENQFDLSRLQTRDGKAVMWGLPYMLAHIQASEKNDSSTDTKYSPFSVEGLSVSSAPNALTTSSVENGKMLSYLQANNEQNRYN